MSVIDEVKTRLDIVDVISSYIPVDKKGHHYKAICPFHTEKTPSFIIFPDSQTWRCFGQCGDGGDIFSFVMKQEGLTFWDALQKLANRAGVAVEKLQSRKSEQEVQQEERLFGILKESALFFHEHLPHSLAEDYLFYRGLTLETAEKFLIGYAPNNWQDLYHHLIRLGYEDEDLLAAGVANRGEKTGKLYDRFRHRFILPIFDPHGRVVGFGARALENEQAPKYLNSPQSVIFDKSRLLYALHQARRAIREQETVVVVEGYLDVIQAHQAGFQNVVGTMGTALTKDHIKLLSQYAPKLVLALDTDEAGLKATLRGLETAREALGMDQAYKIQNLQGMTQQAGKLKMDICILRLPFGKDPDEFIRNYPDQWQHEVKNAQPLADYLINLATADLSPTATILERERIAQELLPLLTATEDKQTELRNLQHLSLKLRLDERAIVGLAMEKTQPTSALPLTRGRVKHYDSTTKSRGGNVKYQETALDDPSKRFSLSTDLYQLERYCLGALIIDPFRLFEVNRLLHELAYDPTSALYMPLHEADFSYSEFKAIYHDLNYALQKIVENPLGYFADHLDPLLREVVDDILVIPLEVYVRQNNIMRTEFTSYKGEGLYSRKQRDDLLHRVAELRHKRIQRECHEAYVLLKEAEEQHDQEVTLRWAAYYEAVLPTLARFQASLQNLMK